LLDGVGVYMIRQKIPPWARNNRRGKVEGSSSVGSVDATVIHVVIALFTLSEYCDIIHEIEVD